MIVVDYSLLDDPSTLAVLMQVVGMDTWQYHVVVAQRQRLALMIMMNEMTDYSVAYAI